MIQPARTNRLSGYILLFITVIMLSSTALDLYLFRDLSFHEDELQWVHGSRLLGLGDIVPWMGRNGIHPPGWLLVGIGWVKLTGIHEYAVRHFATLTQLIALALMFRLGADLFDRRTGLYALFLLATLPFGLFYMHLFRPYGAMVVIVLGSELMLLRWIRAPRFKYALLYVLFGIAAVQTHFYGNFLILAQAITFVIVVRWDRGLYLRALGLFAAIGLSLLSWALPILNRLVIKGGITYALPSDAFTLATLYRSMGIKPGIVGGILLILALALPMTTSQKWRNLPAHGKRFRSEPEWRKLYILLPPVLILMFALVTNRAFPNLTSRNLIVALPAFALLGAYSLDRLPWQISLIACIVIAGYAPVDFKAEWIMPLRGTVAFISSDYTPGDRIVMHNTMENVVTYYLLDWLPGNPTQEQMFNIGRLPVLVPVDFPAHYVLEPSPAALEEFRAFLGDADRVWYILGGYSYPTVDPFIAIIDEHYTPVRSTVLPGDTREFTITEYVRRTDDGSEEIAHSDG